MVEGGGRSGGAVYWREAKSSVLSEKLYLLLFTPALISTALHCPFSITKHYNNEV